MPACNMNELLGEDEAIPLNSLEGQSAAARVLNTNHMGLPSGLKTKSFGGPSLLIAHMPRGR